MDIITLILMIGLLSYLIYLLMDEPEEDHLQERLKKFAASKHKSEDGEEEKEEKVELKQALYKLFEPIIYKILEGRKNSKSLNQMLLEAGISSSDEDVFKLMTQKVIYSIMGLLLALFLTIIGNSDPNLKLQLCIIAPLACYKLPDFKLKRLAKQRADEITYNLPDALDLLTVCVEAGLGLDSAMSRVSQEVSRTSPILARELGRVSKDILAGVPRHEAFRNLSTRNQVQDLQTFAALLVQTDKLGTSISQSLRVYSDTTRTKRRQRVEALASKASVKMVIPLVLFILPAMFVVLLAPAVISLMNNFKGTNL